jgi:hypothetical protein
VVFLKFYGREKELELMELLDSAKPSFLVITGRRRIGKTELIKEFSKEKRFVYFFVDKNRTTGVLLNDFRAELESKINIPDYVKFDRPDEFFEFILKLDVDLVIAFDEFQRFGRSDPSFIGSFQKMWDLHGNGSRVMMLVSGSSMGMIRRIFIESGSPLFKRADNIVVLKSFSIGECFEIMADLGIYDIDDKLNIFLLFGGVIYYYRLMEKYRIGSFDEVINKLILDDLAPLRNEVMDVLIEEFGSDHLTYHEILAAIALGKTTKKEIGDMTHIEPTSLSPYLYDLNDILGIVRSTIPVTDDPKRSKKTRFFLDDNFFRFHYRFVYRNIGDYQLGNHEKIRKIVREQWNGFRGRVFEDVALEFVQRKFSTDFHKIGKYWDRKGNELDIVGIDGNGRIGLVIEVKARNMARNEIAGELEILKRKVFDIFGEMPGLHYGIMGIRLEDKQLLREKGYICFDLEDMISE